MATTSQMTRLEQMRLDAHLSLTQLADATSVPERTIRELEAGRVRKPRVETLAPLATRFGVPVSELRTNFAAVYDAIEAAAFGEEAAA